MELNGVTIDNTYAEAFPTWVCRIIITAVTKEWAEKAATEATKAGGSAEAAFNINIFRRGSQTDRSMVFR